MIQMYEGLVFYINLARFGRRIVSEGEKITFPEFPDSSAVDDLGRVPLEKCTFEINDLYNVRLFISQEKNIVKNDFSFKPSENLFILTGPNRGGKTIIEQALGIISLLAAAGCYVTASKCKGVPFSNILTHFPIDENLTINYGRLGEEAVRIKEIVGEADNRTLILFNETYSTTSAEDGLYLSKDLLRVLKEKGSAVIFNTHIHEVARSIEEMNKWNGESKFVSLIMEIVNNENTFKVKRSEPDSCSYAMNIARKYGITYEQMTGKES
jgi:DNA mismatch repair ATPase MutS